MAKQPYSVPHQRSRKPVYFIASSRKDLQALPPDVQDEFGGLLLDVQHGETPPGARPLRGLGVARVMELRAHYDTDTFRTMYTVDFAGAVYVLHVFQKKSRRGITTPRRDIEMVRHRYALAKAHHLELHDAQHQ